MKTLDDSMVVRAGHCEVMVGRICVAGVMPEAVSSPHGTDALFDGCRHRIIFQL